MSAPGPNTTRWSSPRRWPKGSSTYATTSRSPADRRARGTRLPDARRALCWQTTRIRTGGVPRVVALPPRAIRCLGRAAVIVIVVGRSEAGAVRGMHGFAPALTSFVGRAGAVAEVARLLAERRLVTVTGPGGSGKTRLAAEVAEVVADRFADGIWPAELAQVADPALVAGGVPAVEALARVLARQQLLLVLDNCEHVIDAAAELCAVLLAACDDVTILATSREPLR